MRAAHPDSTFITHRTASEQAARHVVISLLPDGTFEVAETGCYYDQRGEL